MNDYYFYRYRFNDVGRESKFEPFDDKGTPNEVFTHRLMTAELPITRARKQGESDKYNNRIYYRDGVALMQLQNNTQLSVVDENFKTEKQPSHPYLNVIIDHRPGHQLIAIEKSGAFKKLKGQSNSTQRVAALLAEAISNLLRSYGGEMQITPIARKGELWSTMIDYVRNRRQRVRSIEYIFPADDEVDHQKDTALYMLMNLARRNGASDGIFKTNYKNGDEEELRKAERDFRATEIFASREHFEINVQMSDMSIIRSNDLLYAHRELLARDLSDFIAGSHDVFSETFALNNMLDEICRTLEKYED